MKNILLTLILALSLTFSLTACTDDTKESDTNKAETQKPKTLEPNESAAKINFEEVKALEDAKALVKSGADINAQDDKNRTALMYACENGHLEAVQYLVENGATINIWGGFESHDVPLLLASYNGHLEIVKYLLEKGADINSASEYASHTALILASINGHLEIVKFLVENNADMNQTDNETYTALMWASDNGYTAIVEYLLENGATDYPEKNIIDSAIAGDLANVQKSIENGADINMTEADSINSALDYASMYGHTEIVKYLLENGADINSTSGFGTTPLMYAAQNGHLEIIRLLVEGGADLERVNSVGRGETALMFAAQNGHLNIVKYLAPKSDITQKDYDGKTVLEYAQSAEIAEYLKTLQ